MLAQWNVYPLECESHSSGEPLFHRVDTCSTGCGALLVACGKKIYKDDSIVSVEIPTTWFRGDDIVQVFHEICFSKIRKKHDPGG